jgi:Holliday junction resolvase RusA-like endonuclease
MEESTKTMNNPQILELPGSPPVKKNSRKIVCLPANKKRCKMRPVPLLNTKAKQAEKVADYQLRAQWGNHPTMTGYLKVTLVFFLATNAKKKSQDLDNLNAFPLDALEKAGVIQNDSLVKILESTKHFICDVCGDRKWMPRKKEYADNCGAVKKCPKEKTVIKVEGL